MVKNDAFLSMLFVAFNIGALYLYVIVSAELQRLFRLCNECPAPKLHGPRINYSHICQNADDWGLQYEKTCNYTCYEVYYYCVEDLSCALARSSGECCRALESILSHHLEYKCND